MLSWHFAPLSEYNWNSIIVFRVFKGFYWEKISAQMSVNGNLYFSYFFFRFSRILFLYLDLMENWLLCWAMRGGNSCDLKPNFNGFSISFSLFSFCFSYIRFNFLCVIYLITFVFFFPFKGYERFFFVLLSIKDFYL